VFLIAKMVFANFAGVNAKADERPAMPEAATTILNAIFFIMKDLKNG